MLFKFSSDIFITFEFWNARVILPNVLLENKHFVAIPSICNQRSLDKLKILTHTFPTFVPKEFIYFWRKSTRSSELK